jgi:SpoVK/Ycf46/Vps4 family AAA+-type ATPase
MKKQSVVNLIKYHMENNNEAFIAEAIQIAKEFDLNGDSIVAQYLMELVSNTNVYIPQSNYKNLRFLKKQEYSTKPLLLPNIIEEDVMGIAKAIDKKSGLTKFLLYGPPGSGKTESVYQIARMLNRDILSVNVEQLIDSRLGETAKNVSLLFDEINHLSYDRVIVLLDEIDSLVLDRINNNDLREMGRVTSTFLKELDALNEKIVIIATTNLFNCFDKAIVRRFDAIISFERYTKEDLIEIADSILNLTLKRDATSKKDIRLFNKILRNLKTIPYPGDLKQIIKSSIAFSDESNEYDYLRKIYNALNENSTVDNVQKLSEEGYTTREIEILTRIPKSSVARKLRDS